MKKILFIILLFIISLSRLSAQIQPDSTQPDVRIKVNVQRDNNGNIVSYDSTVVITWGNGTLLNSDSLFDAMIQKMQQDFPFEQDSLFAKFFKPSPPSFFDMQKEFERMDEMFMKSMQMMMMEDFFENFEKNSTPQNNNQKKKTINNNVKISPTKI